MNLNPLYVEFFNTQTVFQAKTPEMNITGVMFGERKFKAFGKTFIYEKKNHLFTELSYGKEKKPIYAYKNGKIKPCNLVGGIYKVRKEFG